MAYDDVDQDGIVDGTGVAVNTLKVLHALALGQNFQDVTTGVGGGKVCGEVGSLSAFLVAMGPALTTTTTSVTTTSTTSATPTSTTTLPGGLVPGGATSKGSADCYLELLVAGIENLPPQVEDSRKILCTDGEACDRGPCGDKVCSMRAGMCINHNDARLPGCTPPAALEKASVTSKLGIAAPQTLAGAAYTELVAFAIEDRVNGKGKYLAKKSRQSLKGTARAPKGSRPRAVPGGGALQVRRNSSPSKRPEVRHRSMYSK